jgi:hypothetical protein
MKTCSDRARLSDLFVFNNLNSLRRLSARRNAHYVNATSRSRRRPIVLDKHRS